MTQRTTIGNWLAVLAGFGFLTGTAWAYTTSGTSSATAYTVSSSDLLQTNLRFAESALTLYPEKGYLNGTLETLTDGTAAIASDGRLNAYALTGGTVVYTLDTVLHPSGYDISSIVTYSGWQDTGRVSQHYEIAFRMTGSNTFDNAITVSYTGTASQTCVTNADINLTGVEAIRFTFLSQQNGGVGYKELDVFGAASSNAYAAAGADGSEAFAVAPDDLLQTALASSDDALTYYSETGFTNASVAALTDGAYGSASKTNGTCGISGGSVTYTLDTAACPAGYSISGIDTYGGWDNANRDDQRYTVSFRKVGAEQFTDTITVDYTGSVSQTHISLTDLNIPHVEAVRFDFSAAQENSGAGYKELDVIGAPTAFTDMALSAETQRIASNSVANVRIVGDGVAAGSFGLDSPVTVIDTLTHSATGGVATLDPAGQTLKVNHLFVQPKAGGLAVGTGSSNGVLAGAEAHLFFDVAGTNEATVCASITNGNFSGSVFKRGSGTLTLDGSNPYSGDTVVNAGTLKLAESGSFSRGALRVQDARLRIEGGTAYAKREVIFTNAAIEQTAGLLRSDNNIQVRNTTLDLLGGSSYVYFDWFLGRSGTNVTVTLSNHTSDCCYMRFETGTVTANLQTGGVLYADQVVSSGATGLLLFAGGTLAVGSRDTSLPSNTWVTSSSGSMSVYVKDGGAVLDTTYGNAVLRLPLLQWGSSVGGLTKKGVKTLTLASLCTYAGDTVVLAGTLKLQPLPLIVNNGFEQPVYGTSGWSYRTSDGLYGGWTMSDTQAGIARNGSPWVTNAPESYQVGFLQKASFIKQTLNIPFEQTYALTFQAANRPGRVPDRVSLLIDDVTNAVWETDSFTNGDAFKTYSTELGVLSVGQHELKFVGSTPDGADRATAIDNVQLIGGENQFLSGPLPTATRLTVSEGATLDLNGASQTVGELNGGGTVANATATNVVLAVGGNGADAEFSGAIQGAVSLLKTGSGTLTFSGANTYSGETVVAEGALGLSPTTVGTASYTTTNAYSFTAANHNLLLGLSPSATTNTVDSREGTGPVTKLTDGLVVSTGNKTNDYPYAYNVGDNTSLTYTIGTAGRGCAVSRINIYSGWGDSGREDITLSSISYSTVDDPETFVAIPNSAVDYEGGTSVAQAVLSAGDDFLAVNVYAIRFNFGQQENDSVGYRELEVVGRLGQYLPTGTVVTVASGATLDLNGNTESVAGLSGSGTVSNGTLAVTGVIAPGGTNVIGTLTLAASVTLSGTLLIDVDPSGACDLLQVQGDLNLSGAILEIQDVSKLKGCAPYVIATCAPGCLSGRFASTNLGSTRSVCYDTANGRVLLIGRGTLIAIY